MNIDIADLHRCFLAQQTMGILQQMEANGLDKLADAIKYLEISSKGLFSVNLPAAQFGGKASNLLLLVSEHSGMVHVMVNGILLAC